ncbi:Uncharacterised protein [Klebsiella oxytoca]|nr:Uncharacterised protein [Klebsiella oxytoca]SBL94121.1 Uncharacterised protein [Klebsiella oxytoca]
MKAEKKLSGFITSLTIANIISMDSTNWATL